jgi:membrane protein
LVEFARAVALARWLADPLLRFNVVDRSLALGAQAFGALIPLMMMLESAQSGDASLASDLIERFDLRGDAAEVVREAFTATEGHTTITVFSVLVLVVSVLSFTRRLQRLYEETWEFAPRGLRGTGSGLLWLVCFGAYVSLHPALDQIVAQRRGVVLSLTGAFLAGLFTPYLLLGRRLHWGRLVLQGALTAAGLAALGIWSAIYTCRGRSRPRRPRRLDRRRIRDAHVAVGRRHRARRGGRLRLAADALATHVTSAAQGEGLVGGARWIARSTSRS